MFVIIQEDLAQTGQGLLAGSVVAGELAEVAADGVEEVAGAVEVKVHGSGWYTKAVEDQPNRGLIVSAFISIGAKGGIDEIYILKLEVIGGQIVLMKEGS